MEKILKIDEIIFEKEYYPRNDYNWITSLSYSNAMKTGAVFPLIEVALIKGQYYLVDGKHRLEAYKRNKETHIRVLVNTKITSLAQVYIEGVKRNVTHGRVFSPQEKAQIVVKLKDMKVDMDTISKIIQIPKATMLKFTTDRMTSSITGKQVVLKNTINHLSHEEITEEVEETQRSYSGSSQVYLLNELISLIENNLMDMSNENVVAKLNKLTKLLNQ